MKKSITVTIGLGACLMTLFWLRVLRPTKDSPETLRYAKEVVEQRAIAKREGLALTLAEIPKPNIPDADNAATYIHEFVKREAVNNVNGEDWLIRGDWLSPTPPNAETVQQAKKILESRADLVNLAERAAACKRFYRAYTMAGAPPHSYPQFFGNEGSGIRMACRWVFAKTLLLHAEGGDIEAAKYLEKALHLARICTPTEDIQQILLGRALDGMAQQSVRVLLLETGEKPGVAQAVANAFEREPLVMSWEPMLSFELATYCENLEFRRKQALTDPDNSDLLKGFSPRELKEFYRHGYPSDPKKLVERYVNANETNLIRRVVELKHILASPYYQKLPAGFPSLQEVSARKVLTGIAPNTEEQRNAQDSDPDSDLTFLELSVFLQLRSNVTKMEADTAVLAAGARVLAWKAAHGKFPNALQEAVTNVPLDPFDGKPIRYRKEGAGFVVYSAGESLKYDGRHSDKEKYAESVFRYPAPPRKIPPVQRNIAPNAVSPRRLGE